MRRLSAASIVAVALTAAALAGCGQEKRAPGSTSEVVPANPLAYAEVTLDPKGSQKNALRSLAARVPGSGDPGNRLTAVLDRALRDSGGKLSFDKDVRPWLGDRAAAFASGLGATGSPSDGAVVIQTDDGAAAMDAVEKAERGTGAKREHRGKDFKVWRGHEAAGIVDGNLVAGSPGGVKASIDAAAGKALDGSGPYEKAVAPLPADRLGFVYFNGRAYAGSPAFRNPAFAPLRKLVSTSYATSFAAEDDAVQLEASVPKDLAGASPALSPFMSGAGPSDLVKELPEGSWLATGQPDFGKTLKTYLDVVAASLGGRENVARAVRSATGLDLQRDLIAWVGDMAVYVRGSSVNSLDGALVIHTKDPKASARALRALRRVIVKQAKGQASVGKLTAPGGGTGFTIRASSGLPKPVHVVQRGHKVAIAYGDRALQGAFGTSGRLADSAAFKDAESSLGNGFGLLSFVDPAPILQLAESQGARSDPDYVKAKPYLDALGPLVAGSRSKGGDFRSRLRVNVK